MATPSTEFANIPLPPRLPSQKTGQNSATNGVEVPAHIYQAVADASQKVGVSFSYLMTKASTESGFDSTAQAKTSSASGLYQFISSTWLDMVKKHGADYGLGDLANAITRKSDGTLTVANPTTRQQILDLRKDPKISAYMAAEYAGENRKYLASRLNRDVTDTDLYMAHFLGAGGAVRFLKAMDQNPNQNAAAVLPDAASANKSVFYRSSGNGRALTLAQVYERFDQRFESSPTYYAQGTGGSYTVQDTSSSYDVADLQLDSAATSTTSAGAISRSATPFLTTYLLSALEAPGEAEKSLYGEATRGYSRSASASSGALSMVSSLYQSLA